MASATWVGRTTVWAGPSSIGFRRKDLCSNAEMHKNYQLLLEDTELISNKDRVLFIDATKNASVESFTLERGAPKMDFSFTSHAISIPAIMATCQQCFEHLPVVHVLAIRGYEFELEMGLTRAAQRNLDDAAAFLSPAGASGRRSGVERLNGAAPEMKNRMRECRREQPGPKATFGLLGCDDARACAFSKMRGAAPMNVGLTTARLPTILSTRPSIAVTNPHARCVVIRTLPRAERPWVAVPCCSDE